MPGSVFLRGADVTLRTVEEEDLEFLRDVLNDPDVRRYLGQQTPTNGEQEREWFEERGSDDDSVNLLVCAGPDGDERAGTVGFGPADAVDGSAEIGLFLAPEHWGEGYGTEAARLLTTYPAVQTTSPWASIHSPSRSIPSPGPSGTGTQPSSPTRIGSAASGWVVDGVNTGGS